MLAHSAFLIVCRVMNEPDLHKALLPLLGESIDAINIAVGYWKRNTADKNSRLRCSCLILPQSSCESWRGIQPLDGAL